MRMQTSFIDQLQTRAEADERIHALWLEGSFGRGIADRYSDVDAHLLIEEAHVADFRRDARDWFEEIRPLVLYKLLFDGQMINALTEEGLRFDIWLHSGDAITLETLDVQVLFERKPGMIQWSANAPELQNEEIAERLSQLIPEFWRCIAMLPVGTGRDELIAGFQGLSVEVGLLTDMLILGDGRRKDRGVKAINHLLPADARQQIEDALRIDELRRDALAVAHLHLAAIMQEHGPFLCARWGVDYPQALEDTALRYVAQELQRLQLDHCLDVLDLSSEIH